MTKEIGIKFLSGQCQWILTVGVFCGSHLETMRFFKSSLHGCLISNNMQKFGAKSQTIIVEDIGLGFTHSN